MPVIYLRNPKKPGKPKYLEDRVVQENLYQKRLENNEKQQILQLYGTRLYKGSIRNLTYGSISCIEDVVVLAAKGALYSIMISAMVDVECLILPENVYLNEDGSFGNYLGGICTSTEGFVHLFLKAFFFTGILIGAALGMTKFFRESQNSSTI